jgi:hypothetical protein
VLICALATLRFKKTMLEITRHFEQAATQFNAVVLVGLGITAVLLGLFIWLGGLGLRKQLLVVVGALCGGLCAFLTSGHNIILTVLAAALGAVIATKFEKIFLAVLAGALALALGLAIMTRPYMNNSERSAQTTPMQSQGQTYNVKQTIYVIKAYVQDLGSMIKHACPQMPPYNWMIILALTVIFTIVGFFFWPLASAFCCATLGTISIFLGMTMLLLFKASAPLTGICTRTTFFMLVFAAMVIFGTLEQLMLCKYTKQKTTGKKKKDKTTQQTDKAVASWRTS